MRLEPGEALVVAPIEQWEHVMAVFERLAEDANPRERQAWLKMPQTIRKWVRDTKVES